MSFSLSDLGIDVASLDKMSRDELLEILDLTNHLTGGKETKLDVYEPNDIPKLFHASTAKIRALFGGNRSSKTYSGTVDAAIQFTGKVPKSLEGIIPKWRLDKTRRIRFCMFDYPNSFIKVNWPLFQMMIHPDEIADVIKENGRIKAIVNEKGGFIEFMQYDQEVTKFQGSSRHAIFYDEEPPEDIRNENMMRIVDTDGEEVFLLTPLSGAVQHLYDTVYLPRGREVEKEYNIVEHEGLIIDAIPGQLRDIEVVGGDPDIHVFFACIFDNKALSKSAAIRILNKMPKDERLVRAKGYFMFRSGLVYKEYNDSLHLVEPIDWMNPEYQIYLAIDPHPRTPHAVLFMAVRRDGYLFVVDELFIECTAKELAEAIAEKLNGKEPNLMLCDPLAWTPDPISKSCFAYELLDALRIEGIKAPLVKAPKDPHNGILAVRRALLDPETKKPRLFITKNCTRFRFEITRYSWDEWSGSAKGRKNPKQKPRDKDDHMMENLYRLILINPQYTYDIIEEEDLVVYGEALASQGMNPITGY